MAVFEIQGPDGATYEVDAPNEAAALAGFKRTAAPAASTAPGDKLDPSTPIQTAKTAGTLGPPARTPEVQGPVTRADDIGNGIAGGGPLGVIGVAGAPGDIQSMAGSVLDRAALGVGHKIMDWTGWGPQAGTPDRELFDRVFLATPQSGLPTSQSITNAVEGVTGPIPRAHGRVGAAVQNGAEMIPGAVALGTRGASTAGRVVGDWLLPYIFSEGAGQLTAGTKAEPYARAAGGVIGGLGGGYLATRSTPQGVVRGAVGGNVTPEQWAEAQRISDLGRGSVGLSLSGPEALAAATGGQTAKLNDLGRAVEGSLEGGRVTAPFFAQRPQQTRTAGGQLLDAVAPPPANPSTLGARAAETANDVIADATRARTAAVAPAAQAASRDVVDPVQVQAVIDDLGQRIAADRTGLSHGPLSGMRDSLIAEPAVPGRAATPAVRTPVTDPRTGRVIRYDMTPGEPATPGTPAVPVTALDDVDRARKFYRDRTELPAFAPDAIDKETGAVIGRSTGALDDALHSSSPAYTARNQQYEQISRDVVEPLQRGPIGRLSSTTTTPAATEALLPKRPTVGMQDEVAQAVTLLDRDPGTAGALIRQSLADDLNAATRRLATGENQSAPGNFANRIAGSDQQEANLTAAIGALPGGGGAAPQTLGDLLDVFRATQHRRPMGSPTAANQIIGDNVGQLPAVAQAIAAPASLGRTIVEAGQKAWLGRNMGALADMFVAPDSVRLLRNAVENHGRYPYADALARSFVQSPIEARR